MANTIQVLEGSTLTFQCTSQISTTTLPAALDTFTFTDKIQDGLTYATTPDVVVEYSTTGNPNSWTAWTITTDYIVTAPVAPDNTLTIDIEEPSVAAAKGANPNLFVRVTFSVTVDNLTTLGNTLNNIGVFTMVDAGGAALSRAVPVALEPTTIQEYNLMVGGYSLSVCGDAGTTFNAKYCFNTLNGGYDGANYVLTIKPTTGLGFPTDLTTITAYTDCCSPDETNQVPAANVTSRIDANGNLVITIPHDDEVCGSCLAVVIPYTLTDCASCINTATCIEGSIDLTNPNDANNPLASLEQICLCVNFNCGNLIAGSKILLC